MTIQAQPTNENSPKNSQPLPKPLRTDEKRPNGKEHQEIPQGTGEGGKFFGGERQFWEVHSFGLEVLLSC